MPSLTSVVVVVVCFFSGDFSSAPSCLSTSTALPIGSGDLARAAMSFIVFASVAGLPTALRSLSTCSSWRSMLSIALSMSAFCASIVALVSPLRFLISSSRVDCAPASLL